MCWLALDQAIALADRLQAGNRVAAWQAVREQIRPAIETRGWNDDVGAYTQSFGSTNLDASALMIPIVGFAAGDDSRVLATIEAIAQRLVDSRGLVRRYDTNSSVDGLAGGEGAFLLCTFWLARAYALAGRPRRAREVFERATSYANDVGLLSEQVDTGSGQLLGNFPQAFSHIGLINTAYAIAEADTRI